MPASQGKRLRLFFERITSKLLKQVRVTINIALNNTAMLAVEKALHE
jgi:hypothetical protein